MFTDELRPNHQPNSDEGGYYIYYFSSHSSNGIMRLALTWLAAASIVYGSPHVFSVTDDLLAYPQVSLPPAKIKIIMIYSSTSSYFPIPSYLRKTLNPT